MEQVPIRELNQHTANVLARVEQGEVVEITSHGRPVAHIVPIAQTHGELDDWIASGRVTPATIKGPIPMPKHKAPPDADAGALIRQLRDEESS